MKKRIIVLVCLLALLVPVSVTAGGQTEKAGAEKVVEIEHMTAVTPEAPNGVARQNLFDEFMEQNPNVKITYNFVAYADFFGQLAVRAMSGKAPETAQAGYHTPEFVEADTLIETGPYLDQMGWKEDDFWPGIWDLTVYNGKQWGVPFTLDTRVIFYNKDLFKQAGIDIPITWSDWLAFGQKYQQAVPDTYFHGFVGTGSAHQLWTFTPYIFSNDSQWITQGSDGIWKSNVTDPKIHEALQFGRDMVAKEIVQPSWANDDTGLTSDMFMQGKVATILSGPWTVDQLKQAEENGEINFEWDTFLIPKKVRHASTSGGWAWYAFKKEGVDPQIQMDLIDYCLDNMEREKWYDALPPTKAAMDEFELFEDPVYDNFVKALENSHFPTPVIYGYWELLDILWEPNIQAISGAEAPAEAMRKADPKVQQLLDEKQNSLVTGN